MALFSARTFRATVRTRLESFPRRWSVQATAGVSLAVTAAYLLWRGTQTINIAAWWLSIPLLLIEVHAAAGLGLHTLNLWNVDHHPVARPVERTPLRVAVLIPTVNEPVEVLLPTVAAALILEPAHETWVLDDGDRPEVRTMAEELGARYLSRSDRRSAKAGNLNHALAHVDADVVAILDADHVAGQGFLTHTLGYFDDPGIALVQTPQDFYNTGSFETVGARSPARAARSRVFQEQQLFYRGIQPGKNRWGAAFWCGTGALVRTSALQSVGGVATDSVTEDIQTSIRMHRRGWRTVYHNEVLVRGLAAASLQQYTLQRHRWCTGAMQVLRSERIFTGPGLTLGQRLSYGATLLGWFDAWRTLGYLLLPIAVLLAGDAPLVADIRVFLPFFVANLALQQIALRALGRGFSRNLPTVVFELLRMTPTLLATTGLLRRSPVAFRVTPKGRDTDARRRGPVPPLLLALSFLSVIAAGWYGASVSGRTPVTYDIPWVAHGAFFWLAVNTTLLAVAVAHARSRRYRGERRASHRFDVDRPAELDGNPAILVDLSLTGARVETQGRAPSSAPQPGEACRLTVELPDGPWVVHGVVASVENRAEGHRLLGLSFAEQPLAERPRLMLWALGLQAETVAARPDVARHGWSKAA